MAITEKYQEIEKKLMIVSNAQTIKENQIIQVMILFDFKIFFKGIRKSHS